MGTSNMVKIDRLAAELRGYLALLMVTVDEYYEIRIKFMHGVALPATTVLFASGDADRDALRSVIRPAYVWNTGPRMRTVA